MRPFEDYGLCAFALYGINYVASQKQGLLPSEWGNGAMNGPCGSIIFNRSLELSVLDTMMRTVRFQVDNVYEVLGSTINLQAWSKVDQLRPD